MSYSHGSLDTACPARGPPRHPAPGDAQAWHPVCHPVCWGVTVMQPLSGCRCERQRKEFSTWSSALTTGRGPLQAAAPEGVAGVLHRCAPWQLFAGSRGTCGHAVGDQSPDPAAGGIPERAAVPASCRGAPSLPAPGAAPTRKRSRPRSKPSSTRPTWLPRSSSVGILSSLQALVSRQSGCSLVFQTSSRRTQTSSCGFPRFRIAMTLSPASSNIAIVYGTRPETRKPVEPHSSGAFAPIMQSSLGSGG